MISEAMAGASALKTAMDMAKALKDISDATIRNAAVIELQGKILSAQEAQFELVKKVEDLEKELATLKAQSSRLSRYELKDLGGSTFAYSLKADKAAGEPHHLACPTCFQKGEISILQHSHMESGQDWYDCLSCNSHRPYGHRVQRDLSSQRTNDYF